MEPKRVSHSYVEKNFKGAIDALTLFAEETRLNENNDDLFNFDSLRIEKWPFAVIDWPTIGGKTLITTSDPQIDLLDYGSYEADGVFVWLSKSNEWMNELDVNALLDEKSVA